MAETLLSIHSILRFGVLITAAGAAIYAILGWARGRAYGPAARRVGLAYTVLLDVQVLLGLLLLAVWPFYPALMGHITMMIAAVVVAHIATGRARRAEAGAGGMRTLALGILISLGLAIAGILAIGRSPIAPS